MKKIILCQIALFAAIFVISCTKATENSKNEFDFPEVFPLKEGNTWIYEQIDYTSLGEIESITYDTLCVIGKTDSYYLQKWNDSDWIFLVNNFDSKLICYGHIEQDTVFYDLPIILAFVGETGNIDLIEYSNYDLTDIDSIKVFELYDEPYLNNNYNTYRADTYYDFGNPTMVYKTYVNSLGFVGWEHFSPNNGLLSTSWEIIGFLEDFYLPITRKDETAIQNIILPHVVSEYKKQLITGVSAVGLFSALCLNLSIQTAGLFGWRDRSDPAAYAKHQPLVKWR